jgi:hypothetical protein
MKDELISLFIDDALNLNEKIELTRSIHEDPAFKDDTLALLEQEIVVRSDVTDRVPSLEFKAEPWFRFFLTRSWGYLATAAATACIIFFLTFQKPIAETIPYRFVLYKPEAQQVQLSGSFTGWQTLSMNRIGNSGYWDITVDIAKGEYRFTYILDGSEFLADPSIPTKEKDDFGGENSILSIGV